MITYLSDIGKINSQIDYDFCIKNFDILQVKCVCGHSGHLIKHAYYTRTIKTPYGKIRLKVLRLKCKLCNKTHAVLPCEIVPYSSVQITDQIAILQGEDKAVMESTPEIDESTVAYIKKNYNRYFHERLLSIHLSINSTIRDLIIKCIDAYHRTFMQIHCGPIIYFY